MAKRKVGVLISGGGSNLQALIDACKSSDYPAEISVVISNNESAYGLNRAAEAGIASHVVKHTDYATRQAFDDMLDQLLKRHQVEIVCLAGFMRLLTADFVGRWQGRMLNIHPSLLPAFKGVHVHEKILASGVKFSGCTVHIVRPEMDVGPIIIQAAVPVLAEDTPETLAARVLEQEHRCYPQALAWLAEGRVQIMEEKVVIQNARLVEDVLISPVLEA